MHQLIITLMAIVLVSIMALTGISYIPWWHKSAESTKISMGPALDTLEKSYIALARQMDGNVPDPTLAEDGGLSAIFSATYKFAPKALPGYAWVYAKHPVDGSLYSGLHYFCLKPNNPANPMSEGVYKGLSHVAAKYPTTQLIISNSTSCREASYTAVSGVPSTAGSVILYVSFIPGVSQ